MVYDIKTRKRFNMQVSLLCTNTEDGIYSEDRYLVFCLVSFTDSGFVNEGVSSLIIRSLNCFQCKIKSRHYLSGNMPAVRNGSDKAFVCL